MMSLLLLMMMLLQLSLSSVTARPIYSPPAIPQELQVTAAQPDPLVPSTPTHYTLPSRFHRYCMKISYHPLRVNQSNGGLQVPHFHSGPWDRAWKAYDSIVEKMKIFKRSVPNVSAQERIIQHLRSTSWWQRTKDFGKWVTGQKVKVTRDQVQAVKDKYKNTKYPNPNMRTHIGPNGRTGSAFVSRPIYIQAPSRAKPSRFPGLFH